MRKLLILSSLAALLVACTHDKDPFEAYRSQPESVLFQQATNELQKGHYRDAISTLEALDAIYPFGPHAEEAVVDSIYAYYMDEEDVMALAASDRYIHLYPRGPYADYAYYMKGVVSFQVGLNWLQRKAGADPAERDEKHLREAFWSFNELIERFPTSPYYNDSILRMRYIRNAMAKHEMIAAQFYFNKRAYVAATNRTNFVIQHFEKSPYVIKALIINIKAYRELNLSELAEENLRVLEASYPQAAKSLR
ncbi:MAG TPA: outer membrane protein assembly factor BamD [Coxiellaceae bacterium]|nr:outer membrane protein assembly factor BamD [Coxiellaceae bacterium]